MSTIIMDIGALPAATITLIAFILGICLTVIIYQMIARAKAKTFEQDLQRQIDGAKREAENIIKSVISTIPSRLISAEYSCSFSTPTASRSNPPDPNVSQAS